VHIRRLFRLLFVSRCIVGHSRPSTWVYGCDFKAERVKLAPKASCCLNISTDWLHCPILTPTLTQKRTYRLTNQICHAAQRQCPGYLIRTLMKICLFGGGGKGVTYSAADTSNWSYQRFSLRRYNPTKRSWKKRHQKSSNICPFTDTFIRKVWSSISFTKRHTKSLHTKSHLIKMLCVYVWINFIHIILHISICFSFISFLISPSHFKQEIKIVTLF
jgi:hypothetical protein